MYRFNLFRNCMISSIKNFWHCNSGSRLVSKGKRSHFQRFLKNRIPSQHHFRCRSLMQYLAVCLSTKSNCYDLPNSGQAYFHLTKSQFTQIGQFFLSLLIHKLSSDKRNSKMIVMSVALGTHIFRHEVGSQERQRERVKERAKSFCRFSCMVSGARETSTHF